MNPVQYDFTLISQVISFLLLVLFICGVIYFFLFVRNKQKHDQEMVAKLNRIVDLLENDRKN